MSEPSETAVKTLFAESRNHCFFTACEENLTDPGWRQVNGEIAHIKGERPGSARYEPSQREKERQGYGNLMLLCPKHHKEVDRLRPDDFTVEMLLDMKEKHVSHGADRAWATETQLTAFARMAVAEFVRVTAGVGSVTLATEDGDTMTTEDGQPIEAEGVSLAGNELTVVDAQPAEATAEAEDATTDEASVYRRMGANRDLRPRGN